VSRSHAGLAMQIGGRGFLEAHPPNDVTGARFEGRFVIYSMMGHGVLMFGDDMSLFARDCATQQGLGPGSAHFVAMRGGFALESFHTGDDEFVGHLYARTTARTHLRIYFDPAPDGSRSFEDRDFFTRGHLIVTYRARGVLPARCSRTSVQHSCGLHPEGELAVHVHGHDGGPRRGRSIHDRSVSGSRSGRRAHAHTDPHEEPLTTGAQASSPSASRWVAPGLPWTEAPSSRLGRRVSD
jgi:hypothetical protein